jgi:hypothetical protein
MTLAGVVRHVTEYQVRALESLGWKKVLGANQGDDAVKKDAPSQKSPTKRNSK